jgi:hypothetical protein
MEILYYKRWHLPTKRTSIRGTIPTIPNAKQPNLGVSITTCTTWSCRKKHSLKKYIPDLKGHKQVSIKWEPPIHFGSNPCPCVIAYIPLVHGSIPILVISARFNLKNITHVISYHIPIISPLYPYYIPIYGCKPVTIISIDISISPYLHGIPIIWLKIYGL